MYIAPQIEKLHDLSFRLSSLFGYGHLRRNVFSTSTLYQSKNQGQQVLKLSPGASLSMNGASVLQVMTNGTVKFLGVNEDSSVVTMMIRKLFITDHLWTSWSLVNEGLESVDLKIVWASDEVDVVPPEVNP